MLSGSGPVLALASPTGVPTPPTPGPTAPTASPPLRAPSPQDLAALRYTAAAAAPPVGHSKTLDITVRGRHLVLAAPPQSADFRYIVRELHGGDEYGLAGRALPPNATIVDVGGNVGVASVLLSVYFPSATILTFEPMPVNFRYLLHNLRVNGVTNVRPHNVGLSADGKPVDVHFFAQKGGSSGTVQGVWDPSVLRKFPRTLLRINTTTLDQAPNA